MLSEQSGVVRSMPGEAFIRKLPSFRSLSWELKPGDYAHKTIDCFTRYFIYALRHLCLLFCFCFLSFLFLSLPFLPLFISYFKVNVSYPHSSIPSLTLSPSLTNPPSFILFPYLPLLFLLPSPTLPHTRLPLIRHFFVINPNF